LVDPVANPEDIVVENGQSTAGESFCGVGGADLCTKKVEEWSSEEVLAWTTGLFDPASLGMPFLGQRIKDQYQCSTKGAAAWSDTPELIPSTEVFPEAVPDLQVGMRVWADRPFVFGDVPTELAGAVLFRVPYALEDGAVITIDRGYLVRSDASGS
jgi:hypothetical protein